MSRYMELVAKAINEFRHSKSIKLIAKKTSNRISRALMKRSADLRLKLATLAGQGAVRSTANPLTIDGLAISKRQIASVFFTNVKPGSYTLTIEHEDLYLLQQRKALLAVFSLSNEPSSLALATIMKLAYSPQYKMFAYMGGGEQKVANTIQQKLNITVPRGQRWIKLELLCGADRYININKLTFGCAKSKTDTHKLDIRLVNWVQQNRELLEDVQYLLYADININVVDGSSVWLSSIASALCKHAKCVLISKADVTSEVIVSNIVGLDNLIILSPLSLDIEYPLSVSDAIDVLRGLDAELPSVRGVVVRGCQAAHLLHSDRQFKARSNLYLTDFYKVTPNGLIIAEEAVKSVAICALQADAMLVQTQRIDDKLREITNVDFRSIAVPPVVPRFPIEPHQKNDSGKVIKLGYAGKINPDWGVEELLDSVARLKKKGLYIELHIVANKITEVASQGKITGFAETIRKKIVAVGAYHHKDFNREASISLMSNMDFVWCWRPARLELMTLELSTKLVEMAAYGARCITYPSAINVEFLGPDYPFLCENLDQLEEIIKQQVVPDPSLASRITYDHSLDVISNRIIQSINRRKVREQSVSKICFAGHDFKFIDPFISEMKALGYDVVRDVWKWGEALDQQESKRKRDWADIVFCEWGLANAVWYSNNAKPGQRIFVRVHLQEINERARKFGNQLDINNVEKVIFVSRRVRDKAIELFGWPEEKLALIPNFVLENEYLPKPKGHSFGDVIHLGMVGIIPQRKRFDQAIETLHILLDSGHKAKLHIKGPRPEELEFMHGPSRHHELEYYHAQYARIDNDPLLRDAVVFYPWGNDVALWYKKIDHILSPSDFESFHYALADGVLAGCHPVVWPWSEAAEIYTKEWLVDDSNRAATSILRFRELASVEKENILNRNRKLIRERYGFSIVSQRLMSMLVSNDVL